MKRQLATTKPSMEISRKPFNPSRISVLLVDRKENGETLTRFHDDGRNSGNFNALSPGVMIADGAVSAGHHIGHDEVTEQTNAKAGEKKYEQGFFHLS